MATIELLIAFLSYPPGENAHAPLCALSLPAQPRARERQREKCRVSPTKVKLQYSNLIKSIREFPVQGQPPCCAHRLKLSIMYYIMYSYM